MKSVRLASARVVPGLVLFSLVFSSCTSSPDVKSARFVEAGKKLLQKNDAARAILEFQNAVKVTPKNAEAHYQLGLAFLAVGDLSKGVAGLRTAVGLNPKHTAAQLRLAELMTYAPNDEVVKDGLQRLQLLLQDNPDNSDVLHALALTELKLGDPKEAMQHLEHALAVTPQELVIAVTLANAKLQQKDQKGAEEVLKKACAESPKSADCVVILGRLYAIENRLPEAEQKFQQALGLDPKNAAAWLNLATLQNATNRNSEAEQSFKRLSGLGDKNFNFYHATFVFQAGRREEALKEFESLAKADPDNRTARTRLVTAYQATNRFPEAERTLNDALRKNPKDLDALLERGELFLSAGKFDQAEADLNRVLHLKPESPEVHYVMAGVHAARGTKLLQRQELNEALRLNPFLVAARLELAKELIGDGSAKAALELLNQAPESQRQLISVIEQKNWALIGAQQPNEARKGVDQGLAISRTTDLLLEAAFLNIQNRRYEEARQDVKEALLKSPEDLRALRLLMNSYSAQSQISAGVRAVGEYSVQHPKSPMVQYFLGLLLFETGDKAQAKQVLLAARMANPEYTPTSLALAQVDLTQSNWNDARQPLDTVLAKKEDPQARKWLGMLEFSVGNQSAAIADFQKAIELQPNDTTSLNNLAYLLVESGGKGSDEALKYAQKAVELAPDNPDFQDTLGWVLYRRGLYDNAITHMQTAVAKVEGARFQYHLAMAYFKAGDQRRGNTALQTAMRKDPNLPEAKLAQEISRETQNK